MLERKRVLGRWAFVLNFIAVKIFHGKQGLMY